jgi:DNA-directed RNA polymerase specialized sigma subunit
MIKLSGQQEIDMWKDWKTQSKDEAKWQGLYQTFKPVIMTAMKKNTIGSNVPHAVHFAHAVQHFDDAIHSYKPTSGTKLSSWIYSNVQEKGKRLNARYSNIAHIPENRYFKVQTFQNANEELKTKLNREPTTFEVADHLSWSPKQVETIRKELRSDLQESDELANQNAIQNESLKASIDYLYHELSPQEQLVHEYMFGSHGKQALLNNKNLVNYKEVAKRTGLTEQTVQYLKSQILNKLRKLG